jgi:hypothetical protein
MAQLYHWTLEQQHMVEENFDINNVTSGDNYLYYGNNALSLKLTTKVHINNGMFKIKNIPLIKQIEMKFTNSDNEYINLNFSPNTILYNKNGYAYTELGLDENGLPATYLLPQNDFTCIIYVNLHIYNNEIIGKVNAIQYLN